MMRVLLIANRGEIACRIARTAHAMGITTVAVHSDADRGAAHVDAADLAVPIGGAAPADSYLRADALVAAARHAGADAVHPGYGFLAEDARFARACLDAGLTWVGPPPTAIAAMGDKQAAVARMGAAGVPVLDAVALGAPNGGPVDAAAVRLATERLAFPVVVKASAGGGGTGMRVVAEPGDLAGAATSASREAREAFGDGTVFAEPYLTGARHVEVQVMGDAHGTVVHLGERDCSLQRRHQKIIEESPAPGVSPELRRRMGAAAVAAARAVGYEGAGTVELLLAADGSFSFLEMNTRLQVEHLVTELAWRAGGEPLDLVRLQLLVAAGEPLPLRQEDVSPIGHAIEARLYAEDPARGFLPQAGRLAVLDLDGDHAPVTGRVRVDAGVREGDTVSVHYDPLLAKVIAAAPTRAEAALALAGALERVRVHGLVTNRGLLVAALRHPRFAAADVHTTFVEEELPALLAAAGEPPLARRLHAAAAALHASRRRTRERPVLTTVPPGWGNNLAGPREAAFVTAGEVVRVRYRHCRDGSWRVGVALAGEPGEAGDGDAGETWEVRVLAWPDERADGCIELEARGLRVRAHVAERDGLVGVDSALGHTTLTPLPRFPDAGPGGTGAERPAGSLTAPMPATVAEVRATVGQAVEAGAVLVTLEAMKMHHLVSAPRDGTVAAVHVRGGQVVAAGDVLVVLDDES